ncbi:hypothetical protein THAOC_20805, partial [Thalassiosira oceanica]
GEEAHATTTAADLLGDGRGMMTTTNADVPDPLAMAREAEAREERVVTLNGVRVSLRDLARPGEVPGRPAGRTGTRRDCCEDGGSGRAGLKFGGRGENIEER